MAAYCFLLLNNYRSYYLIPSQFIIRVTISREHHVKSISISIKSLGPILPIAVNITKNRILLTYLLTCLFTFNSLLNNYSFHCLLYHSSSFLLITITIIASEHKIRPIKVQRLLTSIYNVMKYYDILLIMCMSISFHLLNNYRSCCSKYHSSSILATPHIKC